MVGCGRKEERERKQDREKWRNNVKLSHSDWSCCATTVEREGVKRENGEQEREKRETVRKKRRKKKKKKRIIRKTPGVGEQANLSQMQINKGNGCREPSRAFSSRCRRVCQ